MDRVWMHRLYSYRRAREALVVLNRVSLRERRCHDPTPGPGLRLPTSTPPRRKRLLDPGLAFRVIMEPYLLVWVGLRLCFCTGPSESWGGLAPGGPIGLVSTCGFQTCSF